MIKDTEQTGHSAPATDPVTQDADIGHPRPDGQLSETGLLLFAVASAIVTANAYYIHPIVSSVADHFGVSKAMIGTVPAFNQLALALGIFLLLPLGDRFSNRTLTLVFVTGQVLCLFVMAVAQEFSLFLGASTLLGFFTIAPYLLPTYVSKRVPVTRLGHSTAMLTAGIIFGILVARMGAGVIAEYMDWRFVYYLAAVLMLTVSVFLFFIMEGREQDGEDRDKPGYFSLILSIFPMIRKYPEILISGAIQGLGFGAFLAVWMGIGLHLPSEDMGYGTDVPGYLAGLTIFNLIVTPRLGRWADRIGPRKARLILAVSQLLGSLLFGFTGHDLWLLIIPILITNTGGPALDVASRMTFLTEAPQIRTRLMTIYIVMMFIGGGVASWGGTAAYDYAGWTGTACLAIGFSVMVLALSLWSYLWKGRQER